MSHDCGPSFAMLRMLMMVLVFSAPSAASAQSVDARAVYQGAVAAMNDLPQPQYLTYRMDGTPDGMQIGLIDNSSGVWLAMRAGSKPSHWVFRHRTYDYTTELTDEGDGKRYVSVRSFFDPTWYGAVRAVRLGILNTQDRAAARTPNAATTPPPGEVLHAIGAVTALAPSLYDVRDSGATTCANGAPGRALHLVARSHNPQLQLSDVVVEDGSHRFCMIRYGVADAFGFHGIVEQQYANVGGYWLVTGGLIDGTIRIFGISMNHGIWRYAVSDVHFPASIPDEAFLGAR